MTRRKPPTDRFTSQVLTKSMPVLTIDQQIALFQRTIVELERVCASATETIQGLRDVIANLLKVGTEQ